MSILVLVNSIALNAASTASNQTSSAINIENVEGFAVQVTFTGSPSGNFIVKGSNDGTNFGQISTTDISTAGTTMLNNFDQHYQWVQLVWTGSGTGTVTAIVTGKGY
jgi:hypothetical protein